MKTFPSYCTFNLARIPGEQDSFMPNPHQIANSTLHELNVNNFNRIVESDDAKNPL